MRLPSLLITQGIALSLALGAVPAIAGQKTVVRSDVCAALPNAATRGDVAYKAGVDTKGRKVAPADLGGGVDFELPDSYEFSAPINPVTYGKTAQQQAVANTMGLASTTAMNVGTVKVDTRTGDVLFNGRPLTDPQAAELARACRERRR